MKFYHTKHRQIVIHNIDKLLGLVSHKTKWLVPPLLQRPVLILQTKYKLICFYAWCLLQLLFWVMRRRLFAPFLPRQRWFKIYNEIVPLKKITLLSGKNIYTTMGQNIYDVDKKSDSIFETCCLLIFLMNVHLFINFNWTPIIPMHFG